jgi:hypothetical protein
MILDVVFELNRQRLAIREVRKAQKAETRRQLLQQSSTPLNPSQGNSSFSNEDFNKLFTM